MHFDFYRENTPLFKQGEVSNGWYIIYSGECVLFQKGEMAHPVHEPGAIPELDLTNIHNSFEISENLNILLKHTFNGPCHPIQVISAREDFDPESLRKDWVRDYAAIVTKPSYIIHIDSYMYRMTVDWLDQWELDQRTQFLREIPELAPLEHHPELYERLAEAMKPLHLSAGVDCTGASGGWMFIQAGKMAKRRMVDFNKCKIDPSQLIVGNVRIELPIGETRVQTDKYGPKHLVCDPCLSKMLKKAFSIAVLEDSDVWSIGYKDVKDLLPIDLRREIEATVMVDPTDDDLIKFWIDRERGKQWDIYRVRCKKEARRYVKQVSREERGDFSCRRPSLPKPIKGIQSPRQHFKKVSETLFPTKYVM